VLGWQQSTAQDAGPSITVPAAIAAGPAAQTPLPIRIGPPEKIPANSFVRLRGLPPAVSLSEGHAISPGAWAVPLASLGTLQMNVPVGISGRSEMTVSLVSFDGALLAEAKATLMIAPARRQAGADAPTSAPPPAPAMRARPPAVQAPVLTPQERERAEKLVARGERELGEGNVAMARQFLLRAAEAGLARGALLLATTYDPRELARLRVQGVQPNIAEARKWYERARELGAPEAEERITRLGGG
jgi:hypothetical protein